MSTRSAESRSNSPDASVEKRASKKRKVLSCYACRNRKMKCDRVYPVCSRCQKTGRAEQCTYDPRLLEELPASGEGHLEGGIGLNNFPQPDSGLGPTPNSNIAPDALTWKLRIQERRLGLLERQIARMDNTRGDVNAPSSIVNNLDDHEDDPKIKECFMFRGKSFKTQFYGSTSPMTLIGQFPELQIFTRAAMSIDSSMGRIRGDFKAFRTRRKALLKEKGPKFQGTDAEILPMLPTRSVMDHHVALYLKTFETSYRILHEPTFWKEYHAFWEAPQGELTPIHFVVILLLILAATKCLTPEQDTVFIGDSSIGREAASNIIDACDAWLKRQPRKHLTLAFFQQNCLSLVAKRVNCVKMKQDWINSGDLIRMAMAAGMHRDPSLLAGKRISEFETEMRKRLWGTIAELELASSIDCGLQSSLCGLYFDVPPPANVPDEIFHTESPQAPVGRPLDHFTASSYLVHSHRSLSLRVHLMQLLNNPSTNLQYSDVLHYDAQITSILSSFPTWSSPESVVSGALLNLQLRQFLLILHRPYAILAATNSRFAYSFTACANAASSIIGSHDLLIQRNIFALNHIRNDIFRAAMTTAMVAYNNSSFPELSDPPLNGTAPITEPPAPKSNPAEWGTTTKPSIPPGVQLNIPQMPSNNLMMKCLVTTSMELIERCVAIFEHKVMSLGTGYMEFWILCSALSLMPASSPFNPAMYNYSNDLRSRNQKAIDGITRLCFRVLAMQKDPEDNFASSLRSTISTASPPDGHSSFTNVVVPQGATPRGPGPESSIMGVPGVHGIPGAGGLATALASGGKIMAPGQGAWDDLQDMQVDMSGWTFPDFWAFDMGGDS
ncbi:hypothetical protein P154DRAFT_567319 [Amniculicola lignicola CBS 123094]|uniref:Zn(2)-C6 fungal-type domain-containing protein n=1 Tax=Amniculicola lignicola CBS 123094 TaxID=1392246 RepID=A0A6A5VZN8_9PLEO|nr:hypothetical protein P154DRAFT_567319 [Amniculicola lignicola CBS 123094]